MLSSEYHEKLQEIIDFEDRTDDAFSNVPFLDELDELPESERYVEDLEKVWDNYTECLKKVAQIHISGDSGLVEEAFELMLKSEIGMYEITVRDMLNQLEARAEDIPSFSEGTVRHRKLRKEFSAHEGKDFSSPTEMRQWYSVMIDNCDNLNTKLAAEARRLGSQRSRDWKVRIIMVVLGAGATALVVFIVGLLTG